MKIPKIIHYCWFGPNPIPETEKKCIESWKKFFPEFEFKFWNEDTFDFSTAPLFAKQAYEHKKFAFVSDYVRVKVLYDYGGLYFDTDLEVLKTFNAILENDLNFLGFETRHHLGTAIMGFHPKHQILHSFLNYYDSHPFIDDKGRIDNIANVTILTDILTPLGLICDGSFQTICDINIYNREWFYPKKLSDTNYCFTDETVAVHRCSNSWMSETQRKRGNNWFWLKIFRPLLQRGRTIGLKIIGKEKIRNLEIIIRNKLK